MCVYLVMAVLMAVSTTQGFNIVPPAFDRNYYEHLLPQQMEGTTLYQKLAPDAVFERDHFGGIPNRLPAAVLETYYAQLAIPEEGAGIGKLLVIGTKLFPDQLAGGRCFQFSEQWNSKKS